MVPDADLGGLIFFVGGPFILCILIAILTSPARRWRRRQNRQYYSPHGRRRHMHGQDWEDVRVGDRPGDWGV